MSRITQHRIRCSCGHEFETRLWESINTQLSPEAVNDFLRCEMNRPECPACHERSWILSPVLFNDMERNFMVWVGQTEERPDGYVQYGDDRTPAIIYAADYIPALCALVIFRADPKYAAIPWKELDATKSRAYVGSYLQLYEMFRAAPDEEILARTM